MQFCTLPRCNGMRQRRKTAGIVTPEAHFATLPGNRPYHAVTRRLRAVARGRLRKPLRVRVIVADNLHPAAPCRAPGIDQDAWIDLELGQRIGRDVAGRTQSVDPIPFPEQQPAALIRRSFFRLRQKAFDQVPCHSNCHAHIPSMGRGEIIEGILASGGVRLDKALADASGLSRERVKALWADGRVTLDGKPAASASAKSVPGMQFAIAVPPAAEAAAAPQDIPLHIVFEDDHLVVVDKPAGLVVHPAAGNPDGTLVNALLHHCGGSLSGIGGVARPGIVHRIDKDTSGLLVVAKSDAAHEGLAKQFADHSIERAYFAVVNGHPVPAAGTVNARIGRSDSNRKKMAVLPETASRGKHAITHYKTLKQLQNCALVECRLETGRTHQVRVHMASIGHALLGDPLYGRPHAKLRPLLSALRFHRQALHAAVLGFIHPVNQERMRFESELPADMRELIDETAR